MGGEDDCPFITQFVKLPEHPSPGLRVEFAGRLVGDKQIGFGDQCAGDRHALLFATAELSRTVIDTITQADALEGSARPRAAFPFTHAEFDQGKCDVRPRGKRLEKVKPLEDDADVSQSVTGEFAVAQTGEVGSGKLDSPGVGTLETGEEMQQRRFTAPARSRKGDDLPSRNGE